MRILFSGGYLVVEAFFIISGMLLMKSYFSYGLDTRNDFSYNIRKYCFSRLKRLYPEFFFVLLITTIFRVVTHQSIPWDSLFPNLMLMGNFCGIKGIVRDTWFISSLFYIGMFLFGMILILKEKFYNFFVYIFIILSYLFIYNIPKNIAIHSVPLYLSFFSGSVFRTFLSLCIGIAIYRLSKYINLFSDRFILLLELISLLSCIYYLFICDNEMERINFIFPFSVLAVIIFMQKEKILKFLSNDKFYRFSQISYMLFLSHLLIVENIAKYFRKNIIDIGHPLLVLFSITILCVFFSFFLYKCYIFISYRLSPIIIHTIFKQENKL